MALSRHPRSISVLAIVVCCVCYVTDKLLLQDDQISSIMDNSEELWWMKYRKRPYKPVKISTQLIFWKTLKDVFKEYLENCSFGILRRIGDRSVSIISRIVTVLILSFSTGISLYFLNYTWSTTLNTPLVISMESSTYDIGHIDFPAVAVCNSNRLSRKAMEKMAIIIKEDNTSNLWDKLTQDILVTSFTQLGHLLDFSWDKSLDSHPFIDSKFDILRPHTNMLTYMQQFAPKCEDMLLNCMWDGDSIDCSELFTMRRTSRGHCCVFNQILEKNSGAKPRKTTGKSKRQIEPGSKNGLIVYMDPHVDDYAYTMDPIMGFDILLYNPKQYADPSGGKVLHRIVEPNTAVYMELQTVKQIAAKEVRKYSKYTRNCLFSDEMPELYNNLYSYSSCILDCKIQTLKEACKCTPYFFPVDANATVICTMNELKCLNRYREKLLYLYPTGNSINEPVIEAQESMYCPTCFPDCEFTKHYAKSSRMPFGIKHEFVNKQLNRALGHNPNTTNKSFLSIYQATSDATLNRLDVVAYWFEVLSNIAGFDGMVLGLCTISVVEFFYIFSIRLFQQFHINYNQYKTNKIYIK